MIHNDKFIVSVGSITDRKNLLGQLIMELVTCAPQAVQDQIYAAIKERTEAGRYGVDVRFVIEGHELSLTDASEFFVVAFERIKHQAMQGFLEQQTSRLQRALINHVFPILDEFATCPELDE